MKRRRIAPLRHGTAEHPVTVEEHVAHRRMQAEAGLVGVEKEPVHFPEMTCGRCGHVGMVVFPSRTGIPRKYSKWDPDGALLICLAGCPKPWRPCPKCSGLRVPEHVEWCEASQAPAPGTQMDLAL